MHCNKIRFKAIPLEKFPKEVFGEKAMIEYSDAHPELHEDFGVGFMCGESRQNACHRCGFVADFLCDYPIGKGKSCDLELCEECSQEVGQDWHFCAVHLSEYNAKTHKGARIKPLGKLEILK